MVHASHVLKYNMVHLHQLTPIGKVTKPHGIAGRIEVVYPDAVYTDLVFEHIFILHDGLPVPYTIEERIAKNHTADLIKLYDVESDSQALHLKDSEVYVDKTCLEALSPEDETFTLASLIGYTVYEAREGQIGTIRAIDTSSANTLLLLEHPDGFEFAIPYHEDLVKGVVIEERVLVLTLPEGLLDVLLDE